MCGTRADAEDLLQEIFLLAYRKLPEFRGDSTVGTWLYRLAMNRCLDHLKSRQTRASSATTTLDEEVMPGPRRVPDGGIKRLDLERAIARLPEGARAAFVLHDVEGFQHHEVADHPGHQRGHLEIAGSQSPPQVAGASDGSRMTCEQCNEWLGDAVDGTLDAERQAQIDAHCRGCAACRELLNDLKEIRAAAATLDRHTPSPELWRAIAAQWRPRRGGFAIRRSRWVPPGRNWQPPPRW